jgi:hypothetical protein
MKWLVMVPCFWFSFVATLGYGHAADLVTSYEAVPLSAQGQGMQPIAEWTLPDKIGPRYAVVVSARLVDAEQPAVLEMWNHLSNGQVFFSRSMAQIGPMRPLQPDGQWRQVLLPADATGVEATPKSVQLNAHLQSAGQLEIRQVDLYRLEPNENALAILPWDEMQTPAMVPVKPAMLQWLWLGVAGIIVGVVVGAAVNARQKRQPTGQKEDQEARMRARDISGV